MYDIKYPLKGKSMTFRLIEITPPKDKQQALEDLLSDRKEVLDITIQPAIGFRKILIQGEWKTRFSTDKILIEVC